MGPLIYILLLLAFLVPSVMVVILRQRSPRPARFRYRMLLVTGPCVVVVFGVLALVNFFQHGAQWIQVAYLAPVLTHAWVLWRELPKIRLAALKENPREPVAAIWPRFKLLWPFAAIFIPMMLLALMAAWTLRQDRQLADQEARASGEVLAQRIAQAIGTAGAEQFRNYRNVSFSLNANWSADLGLASWQGGQKTEDAEWQRIKAWQQANPDIDLLAQPPTDPDLNVETEPETMPPQPAGWLMALSPEQLQLWQAVKQAEAGAGDAAAVQAAVEKFIASKPPGAARANAEYLGLLAKTRGMEARNAVAEFVQFSSSHWGYSSQPTDTGLPLGQLICYQALRRIPDGAGLPESFVKEKTIAWMIEYRASIFAPVLIAEVERVARGTTQEHYAATLKAWWNAGAAGRQVWRSFCEQYPTNTWGSEPYWVDSMDSSFLLLLGERRMTSTNESLAGTTFYNYLLLPRAVVEKALATALGQSGISLPPYALVEYEMAGRKLTLSRGETGGTNQSSLPVLGVASGMWKDLPLNQYTYPFNVRVSLASPAILYARQRQRTLIFGAFIVLSALAALIGLVMAHRALRQQFGLNEQKSNFVSSVSHELRAPIASVRLMAESLERGNVTEPEKQREYFRFIGQECRRLSALIANVLDFARIEQGRKEYEFEPTDMRKLVSETVRVMRPYAEERRVRLSAECGVRSAELGIGDSTETFNIQHSTSNVNEGRMEKGELGTGQGNAGQGNREEPEGDVGIRQGNGEKQGGEVECRMGPGMRTSNLQQPTSNIELVVDGHAIQQALVNLIDNAIKHSAAGQTVSVALERSAGEIRKQKTENRNHAVAGATFRISVSDCGPGVPVGEREKIFERFYRLGSELRRETQGVGIGLSIVKHIVEAHGGRVIVESEVGKGSRFVIELREGNLTTNRHE